MQEFKSSVSTIGFKRWSLAWEASATYKKKLTVCLKLLLKSNKVNIPHFDQLNLEGVKSWQNWPGPHDDQQLWEPKLQQYWIIEISFTFFYS